MSLHNETGTFSRSSYDEFAEQKLVHNFFIFNKSGICVFGRNYSKQYNMEENLISSFFSALMSFSKEVIGNKIKAIEMGAVKFVIIEKGSIFYGFLCDSLENILFLEEIVSKINVLFMDYVNKNKVNVSSEYIIDIKLNQDVDAIIYQITSKPHDESREGKIVEHLKNLKLNEEIKGIILLTEKGKIIYTSLDPLVIRDLLKEVDFRVKICNNSILKLFYTSKNKDLIFSEYVEELYFIILIFDITTKFGVAEYYLQKTVNIIRKTLSN